MAAPIHFYQLSIALSSRGGRAARRSAGAHEVLVGNVVRLLDPGVAELLEELGERGLGAGWHLEADEDLADVGAVVTVVEEGDVPVWLEAGEEAGEGSGALGEG